MKYRIRMFAVVALGIFAINAGPIPAQQPASPAPASKAQATIEQAAQTGKITFILFYKQNDAATSAMNTTVQQVLAKETERAVLAYANVGNPAEQALVAKFDLSRAPMPMTIAVAPNGAITGMFPQKMLAADLKNAFVTPTMMTAMKALQEGKLVFVTAHGTGQPITPTALREMQSDPHFNTRMVALELRAADPQEAMFVGQMQIDPRAKVTSAALIAPPGVLVGTFGATATKNEVAAKLASAGKCCDDPNCKHHQPASQTATQSSQRAR